MLKKAMERGRRLKDDLLGKGDRSRSRSPGPVPPPDTRLATRPSTPDASQSRNSYSPVVLATPSAPPTKDDSVTTGISTPVPEIVVSAYPGVSETHSTPDPDSTLPDVHSPTPGTEGSPAPLHGQTTNAPPEESKSTGQTVWAGVKTLLAVLDASSDAFGPLKSAVGGINKCIEIFESEIDARGEYEQLHYEMRSR